MCACGAPEAPPAPVFVATGRPENGYRIVTDLCSFRDRLYLTTSRNPLHEEGAGLHVTEDGARFRDLVLDPESQGLARVVVVDEVLYVPEIDPAGREQGRLRWSTDGERFEEVRLDGVLHTYDVVRHRGELVTSNGMLGSTGALFRARAPDAHWRPLRTELPRFRHMLAFGDRLLVATDLGRPGMDYVEFAGDLDGAAPRPIDAAPGDTITIAWHVTRRGRILWSLLEPGSGLRVRYSDDARRWRSLPELDGQFTSAFAELGDRVYALGDRGLWVSGDGKRFERAAEPPDPTTFGITPAPSAPGAPPRGNSDATASLAAHRGSLWAGGSRDGTLYRVKGLPR